MCMNKRIRDSTWILRHIYFQYNIMEKVVESIYIEIAKIATELFKSLGFIPWLLFANSTIIPKNPNAASPCSSSASKSIAEIFVKS